MSKNKEHTSPETLEKRRRNLIIYYGMMVLLSMLAIALYGTSQHGNTNNMAFRVRHQEYNDGWNLIRNIEEEETGALVEDAEIVDLPYRVSSGDDGIITLKKTLPDNIGNNTAIGIRNYHQIMTIKVNDEIIYEYPGDNQSGASGVITDEWHVINLQPDQKRNILEIEFTNMTGFHFSGVIDKVYFGEDNSIIEEVRKDNFWGFMSGIIMIFIGAALVGISLIYRKPTNQRPNTPIGLAMICFGYWFSNRSKMPFLDINSNTSFTMALFALLMVGPLMFLYCYYREEKWKSAFFMGFLITAVFAVVVMALTFAFALDVQFLAFISYALITVAFVMHCTLLAMISFGKGAEGRTKVELFLDRAELMYTMIVPIISIFESVFFSDQLWTELSWVFRTTICIYAILYMVNILGRTYLVVQDRVKVAKRLEESQLELMMGQIQPHFIFNTLSSIRTLVKVDPSIAYDMLYDFSNYLRANVDNVTNLDGIQFAAEVDHIKSYVNIEQVRFGARLHVEYEIEAHDFVVPPLSIQPLVENAIKHGVCQKVEGGTVWLRSYEEDDYNIVEVQDTGIGFTVEAIGRAFCVAQLESEDSVGISSQIHAKEAAMDVLKHLDALDADGNPLDLTSLEAGRNLSGNGSEEHQSTGMMNIILRLKEMANAEIEIKSREGVGTKIKVMFPKNKNN